MAIVAQQRDTVGVAPACAALSVPRATFYRRQKPKVVAPGPRRSVPRALADEERTMVLAMLNDDRFADLPPAQVYATLLDEGKFVCSISTMYRVLRENRQVRERRNQLWYPRYQAPELLATRPNELWSWDITKLKGPAKWTYFYLYVILDVFSRYVVGWMAAYRESAALANRLIEQSCERQKIKKGERTIHADRGPSMIAKNVALLLSDLGVVKTHGRPHVSNDNPYSESHFKTLKYRPEFPERFGSLQDARSFLIDFFTWYNTMHHHSGLGLMTPFDVHYGLAGKRFAEREAILKKAFEATPEQKELLERLSPPQVRSTDLAGEKIKTILSRAPGNDAPIDGLKVIAESGWFAARPSGTEDLYKIYAENFRGADHLRRILKEAQTIVNGALAAVKPPGDGLRKEDERTEIRT